MVVVNHQFFIMVTIIHLVDLNQYFSFPNRQDFNRRSLVVNIYIFIFKFENNKIV